MKQVLDEISLDGKRYISVKRAANLGEYTTDYVGQLCREEKVEATRVGRNWYVLEESLILHKQGQEQKNEETSTDSGIVIPKKRNRVVFDNSFILYEKDDRPLLPKLADKTPKFAKIELGEIDETIEIPESIFTKAKNTIESAKNILSFPQRIAILGTAAAVFLIFFSINGSYTASLVSEGAGNLIGAAANTQFGQTFDREILALYKQVAREINDYVDEAIYTLLYEDILPKE